MDPPDDVVPQPGKKILEQISGKLCYSYILLLHPPFSPLLIMITMITTMMMMIMLTCDSGHPLVIVSSSVLRQTGRSDVRVGSPVDLQHDDNNDNIVEQKGILDLRLVQPQFQVPP